MRTNEKYRLNNGYKTALPIYYRNKIYSEEERENLWLEKLDKNVRYIEKSKFDMNNEEERKQFYIKLDYEQRQNEARGYGNDSEEWKKKSYEATLNDLNKKKLK